MNKKDIIMASGVPSEEFIVSGQFDVVVEGHTTGDLQLEYKLIDVEVDFTEDWQSFPNGAISADGFHTFKTTHPIKIRMNGALNNSGSLVRFAQMKGIY